jgi:hypothetical protein
VPRPLCLRSHIRDQFAPRTGRCINQPAVTVDRPWQVSAPRGVPGPIRPGEIVQLGLRNKYGLTAEDYWVSASVIAPDGSSTTADTLLNAADFAFVVYPKQFVGADPVRTGAYTVVWQTNGGFIACDGFVVTPY